GRDPLLDRDVGEQGAAALLLTSHQTWGSWPIFAEEAGFFSKLLIIGLVVFCGFDCRGLGGRLQSLAAAGHHPGTNAALAQSWLFYSALSLLLTAD
ncbi:hypothetical protein, partial [Synechococcus sp. CCY9202]|uniref:hypothetical protein n=1 Tax=Synechococcus sp. CCY9202 TaxID=174698 RepID=UPI002B1FAD46